LAVLWTQHLWWRAPGKTSSRADQKPRGGVADRQLGRFGHPSLLEIEQQALPRKLAFALPVEDADHLLGPVGKGSHDHQHAGPVVGEAHVEVDAVGPEVDVVPAAEIARVPLLEVGDPALCQTRDVAGREALGPLAQKGLQSLGHGVGGDALEIQQRDQAVQGGRAASVRRKDRADEALALASVVDPRLPDFHRAGCGLDLPLGKAPVAHDQPTAVSVEALGVLGDVLLDFEFDGAGEHLLGAAAQDLVELAAAYEACVASLGVGVCGWARCAFHGAFW
jgi:hypothetical protein